MENNLDKRQLRKVMQQKRNKLSGSEQQERSRQIAQQLLQSELYRTNRYICIYQAFRNEVSCDTIMQEAWKHNKEVYVPVTDEVNQTMEFYPVTGQTQWQQGAYGIMEPVLEAAAKPLTESALILMPGLAFDRNKHRIGYGGGYYDKYLAEHTMHTTAALCYDFQVISEDLPYEEHDILPDYIITEYGIL